MTRMDITPDKRTEVNLERLEYAIKIAPVGIFRTDTEGNCIYVNDRWCEIAGLTPEEAFGQGWEKGLHCEDKASIVVEWCKSAREKRPFAMQYRFQRPDGQVTWVYGQAEAEKSPDGEIVGYVGTITDINAQKQTEEQLYRLNQELEERVKQRTAELEEREARLRDLSERLTLALHSGDMGYWEWTIATDTVFWDKRLYELHDIPLSSPPSYEVFINTVHPEDRNLLQSLVQNAINSENNYANRCGRSSPYEVIYRVIHGDGRMYYIKSYGTVIRDSLDRPLRMVGISFNITHLKETEIALRESQQFLQTVLDTFPLAVFWKNRESVLLGCNHVFARLMGLAASQEVIGKRNFDFSFTPDEVLKYTEDDRQVIQSGVPKLGIEETITLPTGEQRWVETNKLPLRDLDKNIIGVLGTFQDISERKQVEISLKAKTEELNRLTRLKDEFLANMSHELRTPLNSILGLNESLQDGIFGPINQEQAMALKTIENSSFHLLSLIDDILDVAKIESGQVNLESASVSIYNICSSSLTFIKQQALKKGVQIDTKLPPNLPNLFVDELRIRQVLINLLSNAVKFTPSGGKITLTVSRALPSTDGTEYLRITVSDTGIGISPEDIPKLFRPFVQVNSAHNRQYSGTGLGLALVKQIVELHGGQVTLNSEVGKGSDFSIYLPCDRAPQRPFQPEPSLRADEEMMFPDRLTPTNFISPLILLVDDHQANIATFEAYLKSQDYRIIKAYNGREAVNLARSQTPDLILMDIQMPEMDGLEAIKEIRRHQALKEVPIIALTALVTEGDQERCLQAGANDFLGKPVKLRQLVTIIKRSING